MAENVKVVDAEEPIRIDYSRFTDRARKVMQLAAQEAKRLNHEFVGTAHILLGLVKEGSGIAATLLKGLDVDLRKIRFETEKIITPGSQQMILGRLPHGDEAKDALRAAIEESAERGDRHVGTEHLLLGLIVGDRNCTEQSDASKILLSLGLTPDAIRDDLKLMLDVKKALPGELRWTAKIGPQPAVSGDPQPTFAVGDVVRLRSGGPAMTVGGDTVGIKGRSKPETLFCQWFDELQVMTAHFSAAALVKVDAEAERIRDIVTGDPDLARKLTSKQLFDLFGFEKPKPSQQFRVGDMVNDTACGNPDLDMRIEKIDGILGEYVLCSWDVGEGPTTGIVPKAGLRLVEKCTPESHVYPFKHVTCRCGKKTRMPTW